MLLFVSVVEKNSCFAMSVITAKTVATAGVTGIKKYMMMAASRDIASEELHIIQRKEAKFFMEETKKFCLENGFYPDGIVPEEDLKNVDQFLRDLEKFDEMIGIA